MPPKWAAPQEKWAAEAEAMEKVEKRCAHIVWGSPEQVDSSASASDMAGDSERLRGVNFLNESFSSRGNSLSISGSFNTSSASRQTGNAGHTVQAWGGVRRRSEEDEEEATEDATAQLRPRPPHEPEGQAGRGDGHFGPFAEEEEEEEEDEAGPRALSGAGRTFMPSLGSKDHEHGGCKPCSYFMNKNGCVKGADCAFCHLEHEMPSRARPFKAKRLRCKKLAKSLGLLEANNFVKQSEETKEQLSREGTYMLELLRGRIKHLEEEDALET